MLHQKNQRIGLSIRTLEQRRGKNAHGRHGKTEMSRLESKRVVDSKEDEFEIALFI